MKAISRVEAGCAGVETSAGQATWRWEPLRLSFGSARSLFAELTLARLELLDRLRRVHACSVAALAKEAQRNEADVQTDVARLEELGLIERTEEGELTAPYESLEIVLPFARTGTLQSLLRREAERIVDRDPRLAGQAQRNGPLEAFIPTRLRDAIAALVARKIQSNGGEPQEPTAFELERARANALIEELRSKGVEAEVIGSLRRGDWREERSDVDILLLGDGYAALSVADDLASTFLSRKFDLVLLDTLTPTAREFMLDELARAKAAEAQRGEG